MTQNENSFTADSVSAITDANKLVEDIKVKYGVARPITKQLILDYGLSLPKIFEELERLGYPVPGA